MFLFVSLFTYPSPDLLPSNKVCQALKNGCRMHGAFGHSVVYFNNILVPNIFIYDKNVKRWLVKQELCAGMFDPADVILL